VTFVQVQHEIPITLANFNRRKAIYTALVIAKGVVGIMGGLAVLGWIFTKTRERMRKDEAL
jgi:hypothetical protein